MLGAASKVGCPVLPTQMQMRWPGVLSAKPQRPCEADWAKPVDSKVWARRRPQTAWTRSVRLNTRRGMFRTKASGMDDLSLESLEDENARMRAALEKEKIEAAEIDRLLKENAELRELVEEQLGDLDASKRAKFIEAHNALVQMANIAGFEIPPFTQGSEEASSSVPHFSSEATVVHGKTDVTYTFKTTNEEMEVPSNSGSFFGLGSGRFGLPKVFSVSVETVEEADSNSDSETVASEEAGRKLEGEGEEVVEIEEVPEDDGQSKAAQLEVDAHVPGEAAKDKSHWLYFTVPETPVAGADVALYFNKAASESLRYCSNVQVSAGFNEWELELKPSSVLQMSPCSLELNDGSDWWSTKFQIPEETYEMNFIFTDGNGAYDNNYGNDFLSEIIGGITQEEWWDGAPLRSLQAMESRMEAERKVAEEAEEKRKQRMAQQDLERAQWRVGEIKAFYDEWRKGGLKKLQYDEGDGGKLCWKLSGDAIAPGDKVNLMYNQKAGPLWWLDVPDDQTMTLRIGANGWKDTVDVQLTKCAEQPSTDDVWWETEVEIPVDAIVMNFVVQYYEHFDNNNGCDHKVLVDLPGKASTVDEWLESLTETLRAEERATRELTEEYEKERRMQRDELRQQGREHAMQVARRQIKHVLYTDPPVVRAGEEVDVYYCPNDTCLNGREDVYLTGGWNRWTHRKSFGPIKMTPPKEGTHWKATVDVPLDAYKMDFVFSDVDSGDGTYDNRGGLDYHVPIEGAVVEEPPLHVVHISVEMAPVAKVGGLGDVVTSLGRAVKEQGNLVEVILPRYDFFLHSPVLNNMQYETDFDWGGTKIFVSSQIVEDLRVFFIEPQNGFFATDSVYGRNDDGMRFEFFCNAALEFLLQTGRQPDILHCHDWSTAAVSRAYWENYHSCGLWKPKVVFTIHNLNYGQIQIGDAANHAQRFTTVSPTYAFEVGGHPAINPHVGKFMGIRNGIDMDLWDPSNDQFLPMPFTFENVVEGKRAAREELSRRLGVAGWKDAPMVGVVSRLTKQKGVHLIKHAAWRTLDRSGIFVLLGSAPDPKIQGEFNALAGSLSGENAAFYFAYDEPLSHLMYAACDFVVVPSMFEPCGLTQMIAMRYGTVPVVRSTGGLHDTVFDVDCDKARGAWEMEGSSDWERDDIDQTNGFAFEGTDTGAIDYALNRAIDSFYNDRQWFHKLQERVMKQDWSWNRPALDYIELYYAALKS